MIIALAIFIASFLTLFFFLTIKVPRVHELPEEKKEKTFSVKEGIEKTGNVLRGRGEHILCVMLSSLRRFVWKIERMINKWLSLLRKKKKNKES